MSTEATPSNLREYLAVLWLRKWTIAVIALVAVAAALLYAFQQEPLYSSSAEVLVVEPGLSVEDPAPERQINMNTEQRKATSAPVAEMAREAIREAGLDPGSVSVDAVAGTEAFLFTGTSPLPEAAQATAQAYADAYLAFRIEEALARITVVRRPLEERVAAIRTQMRDLNARIRATSNERRRGALMARYAELAGERASLERQLNQLFSEGDLRVGEILHQADLPTEPSNPDLFRAGALGLFVGLALGIGVAFLQDRLDQRVRSRDEVEAYAGAPVLAIVPETDAPPPGAGPITVVDPHSEASEAYKGLRARIQYLAAHERLRTILITSARPQEGKTTTTANLGVALAQSGVETTIVSADLRRPTLESWFPGTNGTGLSDVLLGSVTPRSALVFAGVGALRVLHTGRLPQDSSEMLGSPEMKELLGQLTEQFEFVILDSAPILGIADTLRLAQAVDGVLLVADAQQATPFGLDEVRYVLDQVGAKLIGVVLTKYQPTRFRPYSYYGRYGRYGYEPQPHHAAGTPGDRAQFGTPAS